MKKITAWILVLVLCLGLFAGCTQPPVGSTPNATTGGTEENPVGTVFIGYADEKTTH